MGDDGPWLAVDKQSRPDSFRQLEEILPTPNDQRTASGAPGANYWQQRASHVIHATLDDEAHAISGRERVRYENHSPDALSYLWMQLDQNRFRWSSTGEMAERAPDLTKAQSIKWLKGIVLQQSWEGGLTIGSVTAADGSALAHTVVDTMMRIDLPTPLAPGATLEFDVTFSFPIINSDVQRARSNYELLPDSKLPIYEMAQWFPRMAAYTDVNGWQHKQFVGSGEFTLEFGDYEVALDVPDHFVVAATGELQNPADVLSGEQHDRLRAAATAERPVFIVTPDEARANEQRTASGRKVWRFAAKNVRDFAWAASPTFVWDALGVKVPGAREDGVQTALAISFYPPLAAELWSLYSTQAVAHTIESYSRHAYPYPYPVAISVNGPVGGMEYPMISFNGPRPEKDGTWSKGSKYGLIGVVIHEVGHNWFPMIINSDERQWTWMDEGLNTFCQYLAEQEWEAKYPSGRGEPYKLADYMASRDQVPVMTNSESLLQFGLNSYAKPATALNVLRESVLGRELFDFAFKEYCRRWAFKRPQPADLFRTMEDASGMDLDWFWRGWFYSTDHVDIALEKVVAFEPRGRDLEQDVVRQKTKRDADRDATLASERNAPIAKRVDRFPELKDFYSTFDELDITPRDRREFERFLHDLETDEADALKTALHFTALKFRNLGGLVTFLPLQITFDDGSTEFVRLPAELWTKNSDTASKLLVTAKKIARVELDPKRETGDADRGNNEFPQAIALESFGVTKSPRERNPMQRARDEERRIACERIAKQVAPVFLARWKERSSGGADLAEAPTPLALASELTALAKEQNLIEPPAGSAIAFEFADDFGQVPADGALLDRSKIRFATVILSSAAPPEKGVERPQPVRFVIWLDGSVQAEMRH